ncbi:MAG: haloacid dehalogenase, partial [Bacteroidales bacterium]|nr:haloacid dehalogenase [Bacteroidales bacterium]
RGRNTHIWNIDITDEDGLLVSTCRLTNFIIPKTIS